VEKYGGGREAADGSIIPHVHIACFTTKAGIQTHTHSHKICNTHYCPWQQCFRECASLLYCTKIASLVNYYI
jgi:hypothetical protein